ncbi:Pre-mRNA-splicing factor SPF27 [Tirmania nivea]|nr:Pre-mRNA-splicing factor SPF27 [Tirmania nivea]
MSAAQFSHDSLPYIDPPFGPSVLSAAEALITTELAPEASTSLHPSIPPLPSISFSPIIQAELSRVASGQPLTGGIDLSRYDPGDTPPPPTDTAATTSLLTASHHLTTRNTNLTLLNTFGKNAWLIHNAQLEDELRVCEAELAALKAECDVVNKERKGAQEAVKGEMERLERRWREGVGKVLQTEVAAEEVRREILRVRREMAQGVTS